MSTCLQRSIAAAFLTLLSLGTGSTAFAAAVTDTIRYGIDDDQNINRLSQVVAERQGFFAREGLRVELVSFNSTFRPQGPNPPPPAANAGTVREAMDRGAVDMTRQQLALLINDALTGRVTRTYVGVALSAQNSVYFLVARPEIRTVADLRGKTVTATGLADAITIWTEELIVQRGLPKDAFTVRSIAGTDARLACMKTGECVAAALAQPAVFDALDAGYHILGLTNEIGPLFYQLEIANPEWARTHRNAVLKYIRATTAANRYIMDPANRETIVRITMDYMDQSEDRTRRMLGYIWDPKNRVLSQRPELDMANVRATIALQAKYGILKDPLPAAERFVDTSYVQAANQ